MIKSAYTTLDHISEMSGRQCFARIITAGFDQPERLYPRAESQPPAGLLRQDGDRCAVARGVALDEGASTTAFMS